jgi:hypothetical protein
MIDVADEDGVAAPVGQVGRPRGALEDRDVLEPIRGGRRTNLLQPILIDVVREDPA